MHTSSILEKAKSDLEFLNKMIMGQYLSVGSMRISRKQWISNIAPVTTLIGGLGVIHAHVSNTLKHRTSAKQRESMTDMLKVLESPMVHFVFPKGP